MRAPKDAAIVVVRCATQNDGVPTPRLGWLVSRNAVALDVRLRCYGMNSYQPKPRTLPADAFVRDATPRERTLGYVADPLPARAA